MSFLSYDLWTTSLVHSSFWPRHTSCKHWIWIWMQIFRNKLRHFMAWRTEFWLDLKFFVILKIGFNKKASQFDNNIVDSLFVIICHPFSLLIMFISYNLLIKFTTFMKSKLSISILFMIRNLTIQFRFFYRCLFI